MKNTNRQLTVYAKEECHLCEAMAVTLQAFSSDLSFTFSVIYIDRDPELLERYGARVPVLTAADRELCEFELDLASLKDYLGKISD